MYLAQSTFQRASLSKVTVWLAILVKPVSFMAWISPVYKLTAHLVTIAERVLPLATLKMTELIASAHAQPATIVHKALMLRLLVLRDTSTLRRMQQALTSA